MKKDIVLVRPSRSNYRSNFISTQEPINLCYLAAYLERSGFNVAVWDLEQERISNDGFISRLESVSPFLVGFSCYTPTIVNANMLASFVKERSPQVITLVGGPHASALPLETLHEFHGFDAVVVGEGEETLLSLAKRISSGRDFKDIKGIAFRNGKRVVRNPPADLIKDIDTLPYPARHLLNWDLYRNIQPTRGFFTKNKRITSIYTSRGCPGKCIFCAARVCFGNKVRFKSVDSVLSEVEECLGKYNIDHFVIQDDTFNLKPKRLSALLKGFKALGVNSWSCDAKVDLVTKDMLFEMVGAGCKKISFGIESGSPRIQSLNKKGITIEHVNNAVKWSRQAGLGCVETTFIIGSHPDETMEDVMMTQRLIRELKPDILFLSVIVPYPGTEIYKKMNERNLIYARNWDDFIMIGSIPKWRTENFTAQDLVHIQRKILKNFYFRPTYIGKKLLQIRNRSDMAYWFSAGIDFLRYNIRSLILKEQR